MPRKSKEAQTKGPKQGDIARLIGDGFDIFANQLVAELLSETDLGREKLLEIRPHITSVKDRMKNNTIDTLLKYY